MQRKYYSFTVFQLACSLLASLEVFITSLASQDAPRLAIHRQLATRRPWIAKSRHNNYMNGGMPLAK